MRQLDELKDVKGAPARYVDATGDTMSGNLNFNLDATIPLNIDFGKATSTWARGLTFKKAGTTYGSFGAMGSAEGVSFLYLTLGDDYYNVNNGLAIYPNEIKFKGTSLSLNGHKHNLITVDDIRGTNPSPNNVANNTISTFFNDQYEEVWRSGITVKGWTGEYCAWQLGSSASSVVGEALAFRAGIGTTWNPWRRIYHEGFKPTPSAIGAVDINNVSQSPEANKIVQRDAQGDVRARLLATTYPDENYIKGSLAFRVNNAGDSVTRYCNNPTAVRNWLGAVCRTGDKITGTLNFNCSGNEIEIQSSNTTDQARGIVYKNSAGNAITGMIGSLMNLNATKKMFMGTTDSPWNGINSLTVDTAGAYYNNSKLISESNLGNWRFNNRDLIVNNKRAFVGYNDTDGNRLVINFEQDFKNGVYITGPINLDGITIGAKASTEYKNCVPIIDNGQVMEIGRYIDFHYDGGNTDFHSRIECGGWRDLRIIGNLSTSEGQITASANSNKAIIGAGPGDIYLCNNNSQKYLQLQNNGKLSYSGTEIQLAPQYGALWWGASYMNNGQRVDPSKRLSACQNGWILVWSDYDSDTSTQNNFNFNTSYIPKNSRLVGKGNCVFAIPNNESSGIAIKAVAIFDDRIEGRGENNSATQDIVLMEVLEY